MLKSLVAAALFAAPAWAQPVAPARRPAAPASGGLARLIKVEGNKATWAPEAVTVRLEGAGAILQGKADDALGQASCGGCAENCQLVTSGNSLECRGGSCCTLTIKTSPSAVAP
ncbi:MAG: hypothetical protein H6706_29810 [Myxococcales bacterium]|nr:hypothetical protein [Myxococcales bacterium]